MPKSDPEAWAEARTNWELMPEMTITEVAASLNVAIPTVSQRAKRDGWRKVAVVNVSLPEQTSAALTVVALRRLAVLADTSKDENVALKASRIILETVMSQPAAAGALPALGDAPPGGWPEWLTARRLAYQEGQGASEPPQQAIDPPAPLPEAASASSNDPFDDPFRQS